MPSRIPSARIFGFVTKRSSPMRWIFDAEPLGHQLPAGLVALGAAVLDRDDRVVLHDRFPERDHLLGRELQPLAVEDVGPVLEVLGGGRVEAR